MDVSLPALEAVLPHLVAALPAAALAIVGALLLHLVLARTLVFVAHRTHLRPIDLAPIGKLLHWTLVVATVVVLLSIFGFNLGGLWGVFSAVFAMVAIGFVAVWSVLSNSLCTVMILFCRPFAIGDEIEFPGEQVSGRVEDINFIYTTLNCGDGCVLQIPNNLFFQKTLRRRRGASVVSVAEQIKKRKAA